MLIHIYFHPQGKVWAINQAADRVVFGGEAKGLQERDVSKKSLVDICAEKTRDGYEKFGEIDVADDVFYEAVWVVREMHHRDIQAVLDWQREDCYRPLFKALAHGVYDRREGQRVASLALCWLNDHPRQADPIVPMVVVNLAAGRGCYF